MDWTALQAGLKQLVSEASGIAAGSILWDGEPETMRSYPMATLEVLEHRREGEDEIRHEPNDEGQLVPVVVGNRLITLQITVRSRDQRAKASSLLERLRTRLQLPEHQEALEALDVVLRDSSGALRDTSSVSQQREESGSQLNITLGYTVEERDDDHADEPVESVQVSGEVHQAPAADGGEEPITIPETTIPEEAH